MSAGKGDKYRPYNKKKFDKGFDNIDWSKGEKLDCMTWGGSHYRLTTEMVNDWKRMAEQIEKEMLKSF